MHIDWSALGQVAIASLVFGVGIAVLFAVGVTALSRRTVAIEEKKGPAPVDTAVKPACASSPAWQRSSTGCT